MYKVIGKRNNAFIERLLPSLQDAHDYYDVLIEEGFSVKIFKLKNDALH